MISSAAGLEGRWFISHGNQILCHSLIAFPHCIDRATEYLGEHERG
jgi:hypothetical protein